MSKLKLNVLLAITDQLGAVAKKNLTDSVSQFKNKAGHFKGEQNIYKARDVQFDDPKLTTNKPVASTVKEWLGYGQRLSADYLTAKLKQEATNCSGVAKANLVIDGVDFGEFTTGELMALKGYFEQTALKEMYESMPTISLTDVWKLSENPEYKERGILESPKQEWVDKVTETVQVVNWPPAGSPSSQGVITNSKNTIEKADVSRQVFTGEISHHERAAILERLTRIKIGIKSALETANGVIAVEKDFDSNRLFDYLNKGVKS